MHSFKQYFCLQNLYFPKIYFLKFFHLLLKQIFITFPPTISNGNNDMMELNKYTRNKLLFRKGYTFLFKLNTLVDICWQETDIRFVKYIFCLPSLRWNNIQNLLYLLSRFKLNFQGEEIFEKCTYIKRCCCLRDTKI